MKWSVKTANPTEYYLTKQFLPAVCHKMQTTQNNNKQVCDRPRASAVNMTLPAFADDCHAAAPLLLTALQLVRGAGAGS